MIITGPICRTTVLRPNPTRTASQNGQPAAAAAGAAHHQAQDPVAAAAGQVPIPPSSGLPPSSPPPSPPLNSAFSSVTPPTFPFPSFNANTTQASSSVNANSLGNGMFPQFPFNCTPLVLPPFGR
jgi:hypothetical protein